MYRHASSNPYYVSTNACTYEVLERLTLACVSRNTQLTRMVTAFDIRSQNQHADQVADPATLRGQTGIQNDLVPDVQTSQITAHFFG